MPPNLGLEVVVGDRSSIEATFGYSPFDYGDQKRWKHILIQPEYRYWLCDKFSGSFLGFNLSWAAYNLAGVKLPFGIWKTLRDHRYQGQAIGAGFTYGYQFHLSLQRSDESYIGFDYWYFLSQKYRCVICSYFICSCRKGYVE